MPNLSAHPVALSGPFYTSSASPLHAVGQKGVSDDGRTYRYVKAGAVDLVAGNVLQSPAIVANHLALTAPAVAAGATSFTCTPGATLGTANQYADGFLSVDTTPGNGYTYGISHHAAFASATAFTLYLKKDDPIQVALTTNSRIGLLANPYNGVIQMPVTTATGSLVGVASYIITAAQYGWIQTAGIASVLIAGTPALGAAVMAPGAAAGAAEVIVAAGTLIVAQFVGHMAQVGVSGKNNFVRLNIAE
jgi:hypothetical protein